MTSPTDQNASHMPTAASTTTASSASARYAIASRQSTPCLALALAGRMLHHTRRHLAGGVAIRTEFPGFGRPAHGHGVELERTTCYACTSWHTCLVFVTDVGVRIPLCEGCLRVVVPRAIESADAQPAYG